VVSFLKKQQQRSTSNTCLPRESIKYLTLINNLTLHHNNKDLISNPDFSFNFDYGTVSRQRNRVKSVVLFKKKIHRFLFPFLPRKGCVFIVGLFPNLYIYIYIYIVLLVILPATVEWAGSQKDRSVQRTDLGTERKATESWDFKGWLTKYSSEIGWKSP
jgi:hypothetical protein